MKYLIDTPAYVMTNKQKKDLMVGMTYKDTNNGMGIICWTGK